MDLIRDFESFKKKTILILISSNMEGLDLKERIHIKHNKGVFGRKKKKQKGVLGNLGKRNREGLRDLFSHNVWHIDARERKQKSFFFFWYRDARERNKSIYINVYLFAK